jgi:hypothetical protein
MNLWGQFQLAQKVVERQHYANLWLLENKGMSSPANLEQLHHGLILFIWDFFIALFVFNMTATMFLGWM